MLLSMHSVTDLESVKPFAQPAAVSVSGLLFIEQQREMMFVPTARFHVVEIIAKSPQAHFCLLETAGIKEFHHQRGKFRIVFLTYPFR